MGKQHNTFPNEQPEMPAEKKIPEVNVPSDPAVREVPQESPAGEPEEMPEHPEKQPAGPD